MVASKFLLDSHYQNFNFYNFEPSSSLSRHRWYYFKEGFSTSLINEAISCYGKKNNVLNIFDPFCGSGTTPLQASHLGHNATAIEVNPFLHFTAKAKCVSSSWNKELYISTLETIIEKSKNGKKSELENFSTFSKKEDLDKWLFNISVLRRYSAIAFEIDQNSPEEFKANLKLAAIISAFDCCNAKRDGKGLRYKTDWKLKGFNAQTFIKIFRHKALMMLEDVNNCIIDSSNSPTIYQGDSRKNIGKLENDKYDLVITSPPYLNSFDYTDIYRAELFLGGFINSHEELRNLRRKTLRSHVQVNWDKKIDFIPDMLISINKQLTEKKDQLWNKKLIYMVKAYFDDMMTIFQNTHQKLKKGGEIWLVVSTSAYAGIHIPVDFILGEILSNLGYELDSIHFLRNLRSSSQQWKQLNSSKPPLRESLIIARKV